MNKIKYPTLKISIFALHLFLVGFSVFAAETNGHSDLNVSVGNLCEYIGKMQTDENGSKNKCSFLPSISTGLDYYLSPTFALSPQLGFTIPKSGRDENISRMTLFALLNVKYHAEYVNFIAGTGVYVTRISGPGGEVMLNNGKGSDSFPLPKEAVYSRNAIINLGMGLDFNQDWSAEIYTYIFNALQSEDRAFSAGANITYHFGEVL